MADNLITAPATEPVTLTQVKEHLHSDSISLADSISTTQSIAPGAHIMAAAYSLVGTAVDGLGYRTLVNLNSGTNGTGGTVDAKIQESDNNATWTDWTTGAFTQVTTANDNAVQEKEYTGEKQYVRVVATVAVATCDFSVDIIKQQPYSPEDTLLSSLITSARESCEEKQHRRYITQTRELVLDDWPCESYIEIPNCTLQSVTSIKYKDSVGTETTMSASDYIVDTDSFIGRVSLTYAGTWPTTTLYPVSAIKVRYVCGYGTAASVPETVKSAIKLNVELLFRDNDPAHARRLEDTIDRLLRAKNGRINM